MRTCARTQARISEQTWGWAPARQPRNCCRRRHLRPARAAALGRAAAGGGDDRRRPTCRRPAA
eukprot:355716-Chlamydomonas_euryale.AAC.3